MLAADEEQIDALDSGALFSPCRRWRYLLWRVWDRERPVCAFIGLNPSKADESVNDPTVRRCIDYATTWGYGALYMLNLFAYGATSPGVMKAQEGNAVGPRNDEYLLYSSRAAQMVVAAWGTHGTFRRRDMAVWHTLNYGGVTLHCLKLTRGGHPHHPLYLPKTLVPVPMRLLRAVA